MQPLGWVLEQVLYGQFTTQRESGYVRQTAVLVETSIFTKYLNMLISILQCMATCKQASKQTNIAQCSPGSVFKEHHAIKVTVTTMDRGLL